MTMLNYYTHQSDAKREAEAELRRRHPNCRIQWNSHGGNEYSAEAFDRRTGTLLDRLQWTATFNLTGGGCSPTPVEEFERYLDR